ncbi:MAG: hypothetical protein H8D37_00505 [Chloroflexi bacterium]|nr:hypothetical protein [Chloroflexota bacterium]
MVRGRLTGDAEARREAVEMAMIDLASAQNMLEARTQLRLVQAIRRDASLGGLLEPALQEINQVHQWIAEAHEQFRSVWDAGQLDRWVMEDCEQDER